MGPLACGRRGARSEPLRWTPLHTGDGRYSENRKEKVKEKRVGERDAAVPGKSRRQTSSSLFLPTPQPWWAPERGGGGGGGEGQGEVKDYPRNHHVSHA